MKVAVLGASGHVGKCLTHGLLSATGHEVTAVVRDASRIRPLLAAIPRGTECDVTSFEEFSSGSYDAIINCVGIGIPAGVTEAGSGVFVLTEHFDRLVMDRLAESPDTRYVAFSSGAAYGGDFVAPASEMTVARVPLNGLGPKDYYGAAKLTDELRHRAAADLAIVDIRLFGLFTRHVDPSAGYLMCDVLRALQTGEALRVGPIDIVRDYVAPSDLLSLVLAIIDSAPCNDVVDAYSAAPVSKMEMLARFSQTRGLAYDVAETESSTAATGTKPNYYSTNRRAHSLFGYTPSYTSIETLENEMAALLESDRDGLS